MVDTWILVAQADKVFPLNFNLNLADCRIKGGIPTKIKRRGSIDLHVGELSAKVVVPHPERKGHASIYSIPNEGQVTDRSLNVS